MNADIIFVVSDGQVVEQGSHDVLIAQGGKYAELWSKQIFLKPKEPKEDDENTDDGISKPTSEHTETDGFIGDDATPDAKTNGKTNGTKDKSNKTNGESNGMKDKSIETNGKSNGTNDKSNGQIAVTPNGHKREVDQSKNH